MLMDLAVDAIMVIVMVIVTAIKQLITMITDGSAVVLDPHVMMTIDHTGHGCGVMVMISQIQTLTFDQGAFAEP